MYNGVYLICPKCGDIDRGYSWREVDIDYMVQEIRIDGFNFIIDRKYSEGDELFETRHICGFSTNEYDVSDFRVFIRDNIIYKIGKYWKDHPEELKRVADKNGLTIDLE